ncbi:hypothetical protein PVAND_017120 [Polypedilum vanderplanki]|uniref:Snurportin-1 n=1 Tax=Polypedilum vanderplanki TaxID=319348 RepID=A0A9J6BHB6_POLVA|nr:hypothetical protein PVAND_017120 [Polypedilum vanderplanki]
MDYSSNDFQIPDSQQIVQLKELRICQKQYLEELKRKEKEEQEAYREDLKGIMSDFDPDKYKSGQDQKELVHNPMFKNILMGSKWMMEEPKDLDNYLLIPCPKGVRVSITRQEEKLSEVFSRDGHKLMDLMLNIPKNTQIDGILCKKNKTIYILDVLWYDDNDMRVSETSFRRYWIRSKFYERRLGVIDQNSGYKMSFIESYDFTRPDQINYCFQKFPIFEGVDLDGFLFYHKDLLYEKGENNRVLWLFPYMVDEVFAMFRVHKDYSLYKPINYTNYLEYIEKFNEKQKKKQKMKNKRKSKETTETKVDYQSSNLYSFDDIKDPKKRNADFEKFCQFDDDWFKAGPSNNKRQQDFSQDEMFSYGRPENRRKNKIQQLFDERERAWRIYFDS